MLLVVNMKTPNISKRDLKLSEDKKTSYSAEENEVRYIDDIFTIWEQGGEALDTFLDQINSVHPSIKFTAETSTHKYPS